MDLYFRNGDRHTRGRRAQIHFEEHPKTVNGLDRSAWSPGVDETVVQQAALRFEKEMLCLLTIRMRMVRIFSFFAAAGQFLDMKTTFPIVSLHCAQVLPSFRCNNASPFYLAGGLARRVCNRAFDAHAPQAGRLNGIETQTMRTVRNAG